MAGTLLDQLLEGQDSDVREKVLSIVKSSGIKESDPIFLLMVANSTVQVLLHQAPHELKQAFKYHQEQAAKSLESYEKAAMAGVEGRIAEAVDRLLSKTTEAKSQVTHKSLIGAGAMMLGVLMVGGLGGLGAARWFAQMDHRGLTANEVKDLDFAQSKEGRYAQQLMTWNQEILDANCQERVKDLGPIRMGDRRATSGYCFVWIKPPQERTFVER